MNKKICILPVVSLVFISHISMANPDVTSREYKLLLEPSLFDHASEAAQVNNYFSTLKPIIEQAIARDVTGTMSLDKTRTVKFFDTHASCQLKQLGYAFRERIYNGNSEVTLKFRSPDRYIADFENVSSPTQGAKTKLEADMGVKGSNPFNVVYSHSTKAPNTRTINNFKDINTHFPEFESTYGLSDAVPLAQVGNLTITEQVYKGAHIDLGSFDAELSITLWYAGTPLANTLPLIAEASFKYEDNSADYSKKVVQRAKLAFEGMQTINAWNATNATTKTQSVYQYNPNFCTQ
ncbi:hypothetical protein PSECIP111951_03481 [Pseudoalteromonas holothuriae]|uniref:Uncharacterized protein n=1 Tax=Pseudoalteromonas holothuriae TaxID=2963714 RepID=A0ABN8UTV1_9GAMM|nr:hypothetical protein [Pseudoalteromonas sp. CIP111951]CAH9066000.1 hypothetical protein PSECIP111951_03481 [Pseudoalteromonas sp. CIP111951]